MILNSYSVPQNPIKPTIHATDKVKVNRNFFKHSDLLALFNSLDKQTLLNSSKTKLFSQYESALSREIGNCDNQLNQYFREIRSKLNENMVNFEALMLQTFASVARFTLGKSKLLEFFRLVCKSKGTVSKDGTHENQEELLRKNLLRIQEDKVNPLTDKNFLKLLISVNMKIMRKDKLVMSHDFKQALTNIRDNIHINATMFPKSNKRKKLSRKRLSLLDTSIKNATSRDGLEFKAQKILELLTKRNIRIDDFSSLTEEEICSFVAQIKLFLALSSNSAVTETMILDRIMAQPTKEVIDTDVPKKVKKVKEIVQDEVIEFVADPITEEAVSALFLKKEGTLFCVYKYVDSIEELLSKKRKR